MNTKISLEYGDKVFDIEVGELTQAQKNSIAKKVTIEQAKITTYHTIKVAFTEMVDTYDTNKALLENDAAMSIVEKVKLLWEQKKLLNDIKTMRPEVEEKAAEPLLFEEIAKEQFEMMITGDSKASLMKEIENDKASYQTILDTIFKMIAQEKEKKSSSS